MEISFVSEDKKEETVTNSKQHEIRITLTLPSPTPILGTKSVPEAQLYVVADAS